MDTIITPELDKIAIPDWLLIRQYSPKQLAEIDDLINNHVWITALKRKIHVKDMTISHIKNCIRCLEGKSLTKIPKDYLGGRDKWLKIFNQELINRQ